MRESYVHKGVRYWREVPDVELPEPTKKITLRDAIGAVLRERRFEQGLQLRQMGAVSIGYVSEVERGKKEVSSEVLQSLCDTLEISVPDFLRRTADLMDPVPAKELIDA